MQQLSNHLITGIVYSQSSFGINAYLNGNKTHERHAAGWEVATPYVDEHEDKGASEDAKVEEWQQAGNLAAEQCLSNLKSRIGRRMHGMRQCAIWQKQQVALKHARNRYQAVGKQCVRRAPRGLWNQACKQYNSRKRMKGIGLCSPTCTPCQTAACRRSLGC